MTLEDLSKLAQKYLSNKPVIILGTGATIPYGLPSMYKLADELIKRIIIKVGDANYDIWEKFKADLLTTKDLEKSLHKVELAQELLTLVINRTWEIINEKDFELYYALLENPQINSFVSLLKYFLRTATPQIDIITTNYDRFAEYSSELADANTYLGFTHGLMGRFIANLNENVKLNFPNRSSQVNIYKVHGSLDWFWDNNNIPVSIPLANKILDNFKPSIVTPGVTKYRITHEDPFRTIMALSDQAILKSSSILCIGYGFSDEHVQPKLIKVVKEKSIPIVVITKTLSDSAKSILLNDYCKKILLIEDGTDDSSKIYTSELKGGIIIDNCKLWTIQEFKTLIMDAEE